jgi:predicted DsbA family dithiol-disulfide isomerase
MNVIKQQEILYFTSPHCLFCHVVERHLKEILDETKLELEIREIDVTKEPHLAEEYQILACPTLVFPGVTRVVGNVDKDELSSVIFQFAFSFIEPE